MVSPPQNCSNTVFLIKPSTGKPSDRANLAAPVPIALRNGEFINLKMRYFSRSSASDLSANATLVSRKSSEKSAVIKKIIYRKDEVKFTIRRMFYLKLFLVLSCLISFVSPFGVVSIEDNYGKSTS